jgi:hypothetical protein
LGEIKLSGELSIGIKSENELKTYVINSGGLHYLLWQDAFYDGEIDCVKSYVDSHYKDEDGGTPTYPNVPETYGYAFFDLVEKSVTIAVHTIAHATAMPFQIDHIADGIHEAGRIDMENFLRRVSHLEIPREKNKVENPLKTAQDYHAFREEHPMPVFFHLVPNTAWSIKVVGNNADGLREVLALVSKCAELTAEEIDVWNAAISDLEECE